MYHKLPILSEKFRVGNKYKGQAGLGRVGTKAYEAYTSLREATEDGEFKLPLNITCPRAV